MVWARIRHLGWPHESHNAEDIGALVEFRSKPRLRPMTTDHGKSGSTQVPPMAGPSVIRQKLQRRPVDNTTAEPVALARVFRVVATAVPG